MTDLKILDLLKKAVLEGEDDEAKRLPKKR